MNKKQIDELKRKHKEGIKECSIEDNKRLNDLVNALLDEILKQAVKMAEKHEVSPAVFMLNFYHMVLSIVDHITQNALTYNTNVATKLNKRMKEIETKNDDKTDIDVNAS